METAIQEKPPSLPSAIREQVKSNEFSFVTSTDSWVNYGSNITTYEWFFEPVLEGISIVDFVKQKTSPVVIDLMAPADTLVSLFKRLPKNAPKFGLAVSLLDKRSTERKKGDKKLGITQIGGDIMRAQTWKEIEKTLGGRKADLIMEVAAEGLSYMPVNEKLYKILLNKAWELLSNDNGMLLIQLPSPRRVSAFSIPIIEKYVAYFNTNGVNAKYVCKEDKIAYLNILKLVKTPDSPRELPFFK